MPPTGGYQAAPLRRGHSIDVPGFVLPGSRPFQQGPEFNSYVKLPIRLAQAQAVPFGSVSLPKISLDADLLRYRFSCMVWDSVQRDALDDSNCRYALLPWRNADVADCV